MKYSLADYVVTLEANDASLRRVLDNKKFIVGGQGNPMEQITIEMNDDQWSTESFATGAWVHNKNLSKIGRITIRLSQLADYIDTFKNIVNIHYSGDYKGLTVAVVAVNDVNSAGSKPICTAKDCYFTKIPTQEYGKTAAMDDWVLTCGEISYS